MIEGSRVIVKGFNGTLSPPENSSLSTNYWLLVGKTGKIIKKEDNNSRVLVKFDNDISNLKLDCYNGSNNSIFISKSDLNVLYKKNVNHHEGINTNFIIYRKRDYKILSIFFLAGTIVFTLAVIASIFSEEIFLTGKYTHNLVRKKENNLLFWFVVTYNVIFIYALSLTTYNLLITAGFIKKKEK